MSELSDDYLFVVAIDFGTTYSGYAFSSRSDFKSDPLKISANQAWNAGTQRLYSMKTPTCLLLNDKEEFVSFGYEAEDEYTDIVTRKKQNEYLFFHRFKMQLYKGQQIKADMIIEDVTGKPTSAMKVFAESIKALTKHLFDHFEKRGVVIKTEEIRWVLTVPAIWTDAAKQFMRKSARMAGIADNQLTMALEPEAASIYCQYLPTEKLQGAEKGFMMSKVGTQYMVVDNGGGTVDITLHEKMSNGTLKELHRATGGDCGGTSVDMGFFQLFVKLVGAPLMSVMKKEEPSDYLDIFREFEFAKRTVDPTKSNKVKMTFPIGMLNEMCQNHLKESFISIVKQSRYKDQIETRYDKLIVDPDLIKNLFKEAAEKIIKLMKGVIKSKQGSKAKLIVLVGGFSECKIIQNEIKSQFPALRVIVPEDAGIAVVKGAVLFGHKSNYIVSRIARYTYGIETKPHFNSDIHDKSRLEVLDGTERCKNSFFIYVKSGQEVQLGSEIAKTIHTITKFQDSLILPVYCSTEKNPEYTDDIGSSFLGELEITIKNPSEEHREVLVNMIFGNTELMIAAQDPKSGEACETTFNLM